MDTSVSDQKVKEFLNRMGMTSLEEVENAFSENREKLRIIREMMSTMKELEGVDSVPELLKKVYKERDNVSIERLGWKKMKEELDELKEAMAVRDDERLIDKWKAINDECQALTAQIETKGGKDEVVATSKVAGDLRHVCRAQKAMLPTTLPEGSEGGRKAPGTSGELVGDYHTRVYSSAGDRVDRNVCYSNYQNQYNVGSGVSYGITGIGGGIRFGLRDDERVMGKSVGLLANMLPEMMKYSGRKEDWDDFETGFMIRYGRMETPVAMALLKDNLEGEAKDALRVVPVEEKVKGVESVLKWLRSRLSNETPFEKIELTKMLRDQRVNGKTVGKICEELEVWTAKLNGKDDISMESARKRQLLILYEGKYTEQMRLLTLYGEGASYCKMKAALVELEYLRNIELRSQGYSNGYSYGINVELECAYCGGHDHEEYYCHSKEEGGYWGAQGGQ